MTFVRRCAAFLDSAQSYCSRLVIRDFSREDLKDKDDKVIEWDLRFQSPDRHHVMQVIWGDRLLQGAVDEWIDIGLERYQSVGIAWMQISWEEGFAAQDRGLRVENWAHLLREETAIRAWSAVAGESEYVVLEYAGSAASPDLNEAMSSDPEETKTFVWIDRHSGALVRGDIEVGASTRGSRMLAGSIQHRFGGFGDKIQIQKPRVSKTAEIKT